MNPTLPITYIPHYIEDGDAIKMSKVFARNLISNTQVMATDGTEIGTLTNIVLEIKAGHLIDLMVEPNINLDTTKYKKEGNYIILPFDSVSAIKDYIIIDKMKARTGN